MYRGFNLTLSIKEDLKFLGVEELDVETFEKELISQRASLKSKMQSTLETYIDSDGSIDGTKLTEEWFPNIKADIFISHSHDDLRTAKKIAVWLKEEFNLTAFIDSTVWESADDLLKDIDNKYSVLRKDKDGKHTYNYKVRNYTTAHVHMMLSTALMEMIDSTECVFFYNTPNSVEISNYEERKTKSPWIYNELKIANVIQKKRPERFSDSKYKEYLTLERSFKNYSLPEIQYDVSNELLKFKQLSRDDLYEWREAYKNISQSHKINALDVLYLNKEN